MKRNAFAIIGVLSIVATLLFTGCGTSLGSKVSGFLVKPQVTVVTNTIPSHTEYVTNVVQQPPQVVVVTNEVAGQPVYVTTTNYPPPLIITNTVYVPGSNVVTYVTNSYVANPTLASGLSTAQGLNASLNPTPTEPLVNGGLALATALLGAFAAYKTRQAQTLAAKNEDHETTIDMLKDVGTTLVQNFETLRGAALQIPQYAAIDQKVMSAVKTAQSVAGPEVKGAIHDLVEQHTDNTLTDALGNSTVAPLVKAA